MSIWESVGRSLTARELAGDTRAGDWSRQQAWQEQRAFIGLRWRWLVALWLTAASPALLVWFFFPPFLHGVVVGGSVVGATAAVWSLVVQLTGTAPKMMGAQAEAWTAQEVRRLRRRGWRLINHVQVNSAYGDTDHVLVGPSGVVVLETKWSSKSWTSPNVAVRTVDARRQVKREAVRAQRFIRPSTGEAPVRAAVVLWGGGLRRENAGTMDCPDEGVTVLAGQRLHAWLQSLPTDPTFDRATIDRVWGEFVMHVAKRDQLNESKTPRTRTPQQWAQRAAITTVTTVVCLWALALLLTAIL